jgi:uncharacterized protein with HEPN domain
VSSRDWQLRIHDILSAIQAIQSSTADLDFEAFAADETLVKAVLYDFIVIGEASANIPANVQAQYPNIPWRSMKDMRNVAAHEYFQVDLPTVWRTIQKSLPPLVQPLLDLSESQ